MKEIVVLSGKGGTGKTTVAASLAALAESQVLADCDVEASNLPLVLHATVEQEAPFIGGQVARIDPERCTVCGECLAACRYEAIREGPEPVVVAMRCNGCAVCAFLCPVEAITMERQVKGTLYRSGTRYGPLFHARLRPGLEGSGGLVTAIRLQAEDLALEQGAELILIDGPPGLGCAVIAAMTGVDAVLLVTEPTVAGRHDLERILAVAAYFGVRTLVGINKHDLNAANTADLHRYCESHEIPVVGEIPFDPAVIRALIAGEPVVVADKTSPAAKALQEMWPRVLEAVG